MNEVSKQSHRKPFQFHLSSLLIAMTISCVVFAIIGRVGIDGFIERICVTLSVLSIFAPLIDLYRWWTEIDLD